MRRSTGLAVALATGVVGVARAQAPRLPAAWLTWTPQFTVEHPVALLPPRLERAAVRDSTARRIPRTYWLEGGLIGGGVVGLLGAQFCRVADSPRGSCYIEVFLISGTFIGFPAGALIGGQFNKSPHH